MSVLSSMLVEDRVRVLSDTDEILEKKAASTLRVEAAVLAGYAR